MFGCLGGWFAGEMLFSFLVACTGYDELWLFITIQAVVIIICGIVGWKFARQFILWGTAGIGSYLFVRGFSYFFGGWPSTSEMMASAKSIDDPASIETSY